MFLGLWLWRMLKRDVQDAKTVPAENLSTGVSNPCRILRAKRRPIKETKMDNRTGEAGNASSEGSTSLIDTNPARYYYLRGREAELDLHFMQAAEMYTKAHVAAKKAGKSSAIYLKWYAMRCIEYDHIYDNLKKQLHSSKVGRILSDGSIMANSIWENSVFDRDVLAKYKGRLPLPAQYNMMKWNPTTKTMTFMMSRDLYGSSEPSITIEHILTEDGKYSRIECTTNPIVILHKWMLSMETVNNKKERAAQIRRSIRIEFLKLPKFMNLTEFPRKKYWETYVAPAIGNRSVGELEKKYSDHLASMATRCGYGYYQEGFDY